MDTNADADKNTDMDTIMDFVALPKIELHAHFTGSISKDALHKVWLRKRASGEALTLEDPLIAMPDTQAYNLETFFPLFSSYIYGLLTDEASVHETALAVLSAFHADGVIYLELRTTPRSSPSLPASCYISTILSAIHAFEALHPRMHTRLILSVDRRHPLPQAEQVLALAAAFNAPGHPHAGRIVGIDLCGDPRARTGGAVAVFAPVFARAAAHLGLGVTLHFAECAAAASREEMDALLGWAPRRLAHVICEDEPARADIERRGLCLELCLSCNVRAGMVEGGFAAHHFGAWRGRNVKISLGTDDVGVFGSALSNEYRLVAKHFGLDRAAVCALARDAVEHIFGDEAEKQRLREMMW